MKKYIAMLLGWAIITFIMSGEGGAMFAFLSVPIVFIYLIICLIKLIIKRVSIKEASIKVSIILISYALIWIAHEIRYERARDEANSVVANINVYKAKHGTYPKKLLDINMPGIDTRKIFYMNEYENVSLSYRSTVIVFDKYVYDFKENKWVFFPD